MSTTPSDDFLIAPSGTSEDILKQSSVMAPRYRDEQPALNRPAQNNIPNRKQ